MDCLDDPAGGRVRALARSGLALLPRGRMLPEPAWQTRHRAVLCLLYVHAVLLVGYALLRGQDLAVALLAGAVPATGAWAASRPALSRLARSSIATTSVMLTSAVLVHLSQGYTEAHFHFFVMVPVIALYEDWLPFGLGVGVVLLHHGAMGTLAPREVYDHHVAWNHPGASL